MTEESCFPVPFLFCDAPRGLPALYTGILGGRFWGAPGLGSQLGQELTQLEAEGLREPVEHTAWLPEGCLPKGQPAEEGAESTLARALSDTAAMIAVPSFEVIAPTDTAFMRRFFACCCDRSSPTLSIMDLRYSAGPT